MINKAAVIVLHELATNSLILTQRSHHLREHPGEICFPGGRWEDGDKTLGDTALRELHEELGINPLRVQLQREMKTELTLTGFIIHPWFAIIDNLSPFQVNGDEVASILQLSMKNVCKLSNYKLITLEKQGVKFQTYQFIDNDHLVWGATARIMRQLCK